MERLASFLSGSNISELTERVKLAESLGYHSTWLTQIADREATVVAAAIATATDKIQIGTAVLPIYPRTPVVMAQTAATLDELSAGRFILGLGTSHKITIETWHNMPLDKPLARMREYIKAVRSILRGETYFGEIYKTAFSFIRYAPVRQDLPIFMSCLAPKMCMLAGEVADGAVLWMCSPTYIEKTVIPAIAEGRERAGKSMEGFEIVAAVPLSTSSEKDAARDAFRKVAVVYWSLPFYRAAIAGAGFEDALKEFDSKGASGIPDEAIDEFIGIGDKTECMATINRYRSAGVTLPGVSSLPDHPGNGSQEDVLRLVAPG